MGSHGQPIFLRIELRIECRKTLGELLNSYEVSGQVDPVLYLTIMNNLFENNSSRIGQLMSQDLCSLKIYSIAKMRIE